MYRAKKILDSNTTPVLYLRGYFKKTFRLVAATFIEGQQIWALLLEKYL